MNITVNLGDSLNIYGILLFCALGYFNGYLFRDIGLYKVIALFVILPFSINLLVEINIVLTATLPFLLFAVLGYWGIERTRHYTMIGFDLLREQMDRLR